MSRQQTRIDLLRSNVQIITERRDNALKLLMRWENSRIDMEARLKRALKRAEQGVTEIAPTSDELTVATQAANDAINEVEALTIPDFLKRDAAVKAQIVQEQAERKRTKAQVRIEKLKAKQSGETRRVPLTGKDALRYIREGK